MHSTIYQNTNIIIWSMANKTVVAYFINVQYEPYKIREDNKILDITQSSKGYSNFQVLSYGGTYSKKIR